MFAFLFLLVFRAISGAQNAFGYAKATIGRTLMTGLGLAGLIGFFFMLRLYSAPGLFEFLAIVGILTSMLGLVGVEDGFNPNLNFLPRDIHFWELLATGGITLAFVCLGANCYAIAGSVYPALILHKGFINLGSGKSWWYQGTDDKSGKTYGIPLLGIRIPRLSTRWRIILAVFSIVGFYISWAHGWRLDLFDILRWTKIRF